MRRLLPLIAIIVVQSVAAAQSVRGTVVDDAARRPIPGVLITLVQSNGVEIPGGVRTDSSGRFLINAARAGNYRVRAVRIGYRPSVSEPVSLQIGGVVTLRINISANPQTLAPVRVVERRQLTLPELMSAAGFDLRRTRGLGRFVDSAALAEYKLEGGGEVLRTYLRSVVNVTDSDFGTVITMRGRKVNVPCEPEIYLDGNRLPRASAFGTLEATPARELYGIEAYAQGQLPPPSLAGLMGADAMTSGGCALAVWTKAWAELTIAPRGPGESGVQVLKGTVVDNETGLPVRGIPVRLVTETEWNASDEVKSDSAGNFTLRTQRIGRVRLNIDRGGRGVLGPLFKLYPEELMIMKVFVSDKPVESPMAVLSRVRPDTLGAQSRTGFAYRRERGLLGRFIDPDDLDRMGATTLGPALLQLEGMTVDTTGKFAMRTKAGGICEPAILFDGVRSAAGDLAAARMKAEMLFGAEVYLAASDVPMVFSDRAEGCGLIGIWLKR